jgi:cytochrome c553
MSSTVRTLRTWRYAAAAAALCAAAWAHAPALAADAKEIASTVCIACHGEGGNSTVPTFPRLAGLQAEYITKQLNDYISGKRKSDMMGPIVATLKSDDVSALAAYFAAQKPQPGAVQDVKLAAAGKQLFDDGNVETGVPACVGCHQPGGAGNERYPRLAGQHQTYTIAQMTAFKSGERNNDKARVMRAVAERLTEKEIAAAAEYLAGL